MPSNANTPTPVNMLENPNIPPIPKVARPDVIPIALTPAVPDKYKAAIGIPTEAALEEISFKVFFISLSFSLSSKIN